MFDLNFKLKLLLYCSIKNQLTNLGDIFRSSINLYYNYKICPPNKEIFNANFYEILFGSLDVIQRK